MASSENSSLGSCWQCLSQKYFCEWLTGTFALLPGHHLCRQHHYFLSEKQARVAVSLQVVSAAAHSLLSGCGRVTLGSHKIALPRALPHLIHFIHVFLSRNLFSGGSENVAAGEHFPIPGEIKKRQDYFNQLNQMKLISVEEIKWPQCLGQGDLKECVRSHHL